MEAERISSESWMLDRLNWKTSLPCKTPFKGEKTQVKILPSTLYLTISVFSDTQMSLQSATNSADMTSSAFFFFFFTVFYFTRHFWKWVQCDATQLTGYRTSLTYIAVSNLVYT